jgi:glucokinase
VISMPSQHNLVLAIDIGGTKTLVGLVDAQGTIQAQRRLTTDITGTAETHLAKCMEAAKACLIDAGRLKADVSGVGVTVPGLADRLRGVLVHAPYAGWNEVPVKAVLQNEWADTPVEIANDVNACALGELTFGNGRKFNHFIWVTVSTGIGSGIVVDRQIFEGESMIAGELGHVIVEWENGMPCGCGHTGCLEAHASGTAIRRMAERTIAESDRGAELARFIMDCNLDVSAESVAQAARSGIKEALEIYETAGRYLGRAFSYAANLLNPGGIVVGGGVSLALDLLAPAMRKTYRSSVIGESNRRIPIVPTSLGYEAGLLGAASLVYHQPPRMLK